MSNIPTELLSKNANPRRQETASPRQFLSALGAVLFVLMPILAGNMAQAQTATVPTVPDVPATILSVDVPFSDFADWLSVRRRLVSLAAASPTVNAEILALSKQGAVVQLSWRGSRADLSQALAGSNMSLSSDTNNGTNRPVLRHN